MARIPGPEYGIRALLALPFSQAVDAARAALRDEGFGILTEIDVRKTLKEKLGVDFPGYVILGACNPPLSHRALQEEQEIGLFLPCNVIVYEQDEGVVVSATNPEVMLGIIANENLQAVAADAHARLQRVIDNLDSQFG